MGDRYCFSCLHLNSFFILIHNSIYTFHKILFTPIGEIKDQHEKTYSTTQQQCLVLGRLVVCYYSENIDND